MSKKQILKDSFGDNPMANNDYDKDSYLSEEEIKVLKAETEAKTKPMLDEMKAIIEEHKAKVEESEEDHLPMDPEKAKRFKELQDEYNKISEDFSNKANYRKRAARLTTCARIGYANSLTEGEMYSILVKDDVDFAIKDHFETSKHFWEIQFVMNLVEAGNIFDLESQDSWPGKKIKHSVEHWIQTKQHSQYLYHTVEEQWYFKNEMENNPKWIKIKRPMPVIKSKGLNLL